MNEIIDVNYEGVSNLNDKSTAELVTEANTLWEQMEIVGNIGLTLASQAGMRLIEIKSRLSHGNWESWVEENCKFSKKKANQMMRLAEKITENNSIFSNPKTFTDIGISKVWSLLAAPDEVAENIIKNEDIGSLTVKELQEEIKLTKAAYERMDADRRNTEVEIKSARAEIEALKKQLEEPSADKKLQEQIEELNKKLIEKENKLKESKSKQKEKLDSEKKKILEEADKLRKEEIEKARIEAKEEAASEIEAEKETVKIIEQEKAALEKKLANANNEALLRMKIYAEHIQSNFQVCVEILSEIKEVDSEKAAGLEAYLKKVLDSLSQSI